MKKDEKKDALRKQEAEMLKQFNVEELEKRLEMVKWGVYTEDVSYFDDCGRSTKVVGAKCTINL